MTLAQTAILTKRAITGFIILSILGTSIFIGYKIWYASYITSLPPIEEIPDTKFGILPPVDFPTTKVSSANFTYSLDTTTGGLPSFEKITKVYFMPKPTATFLAPEKSQALAEKFNIQTAPQILSETKYVYQEADRILSVDVDSGNFTYTNNATPSANFLDEDQKLLEDFNRFLSRMGIFKDELNSGRNKINLLKYVGDQFLPTQSRSEAQAAQIYLWPADLDKKQIITENFDQALIRAEILNSASELVNIRSLNFTFWPIDTSTFATYPLKSSDKAYQELKSGQGTVIMEPLSKEISITTVSLAYYQPTNYNPYLQPVFVFEGPGFIALIPALEHL